MPNSSFNGKRRARCRQKRDEETLSSVNSCEGDIRRKYIVTNVFHADPLRVQNQ